MPQVIYDHVARDLSNKAADDVTAAINRTLALAETPDQKQAIVIQATGAALGCLAAIFAAVRGMDKDAAMRMAAEFMAILADPTQRAAILQAYDQ